MPAIAPASLSATKHLPHQTARPIGGRCMPVPDGTADGTVPVPDRTRCTSPRGAAACLSRMGPRIENGRSCPFATRLPLIRS